MKNFKLRILLLIILIASFKAQASSVVILMYHHFDDTTPASTSVTLAQFDAHLKHLKAENFNVWSLEELIQAWKKGQKVPEKMVILTADDGYKSVYTQAYPRLKKYGWSMTTFINSQPIDKGFANFMTWDEMREMQQDGFQFANHGLTHTSLAQLKNETSQEYTARYKTEIDTNQARLNAELGKNTEQKFFAYPYGEYSEEVADYLKEQGYISVTQVSGAVNKQSDLRSLSRFPMAVNYAEMPDFITKVNTQALPLISSKPFEPLAKDNPPTFNLELKRPLQNLNCFTSSGEALEINYLTPIKLTIQAKQPLNPPRNRYACTAPTGKGNFYWWGQTILIQ